MHVDKQDYNELQNFTSLDINNSINNKSLSLEKGSISGRVANPIKLLSPDNNSTLTKTDTLAHKISSSIDSKETISVKKEFSVSLLSDNNKINDNANKVEFHHINNISGNFINEQIKNLNADNVGVLVFKDGKKILQKANDPNLHSSQIQNPLPFIKQENGRLALLIHENDVNSGQQHGEIYDENGQILEYDIIMLDDDTHAKLTSKVDNFIEQFASMKRETENTKKNEKKEKNDHLNGHSSVKSNRYLFKTMEKISVQNSFNNASFEPIIENSQLILRNVIAAERTIESRKQESEKIESEKKKHIEIQEENREIRHEDYKKTDIQTSEKQHTNLHKEINDQETGRPAPLSTTKRKDI